MNERVDVGRDVEVPVLEHGHGLVAQTPPVDQSQAVARLVVEKEVLRHCQVRNDHPTLVDAGDPLTPAAPVAERGRRPAAEPELATAGAVEAGQQPDQRRLAGAVATNQRPRIADRYGNVDAVQDLDGAEALADPSRLGGMAFDRAHGSGRPRARCRKM